MSEAAQFALHGAYVAAAGLFILGLRNLSRVRTARRGNAYAALGMLVAIIATLSATTELGWLWILGGLALGTTIGAFLARWVQMTAIPELVALFNGLGGAASGAVALSYLFSLTLEPAATLGSLVTWHILLVVFLSVVIGTLTLTGSLVAFGKLSGKLPGRALLIPGRHLWNILLAAGILTAALLATYLAIGPGAMTTWVLVAIGLSALLGITLVVAIGGADMPVVISLLNAYSGIAASMAGFVLLARGEPAAYILVISGALVGASGLILTNLMCRAMNRSLLNVLLGGFGESAERSGAADGGQEAYSGVKSFTAEEAALVLEEAALVIVVPGYGLAVAQAQHALAEFGELLEASGTTVKYAIHPVAGRMPGHMNVLLAEANVPYDKLYDLEQINGEFKNAQAAIIVGANDVVNPAAAEDPASPIYGMPILNSHEAQNIIVIKRSLSPGYAGIKNALFERDNTLMLFADAKAALTDLTRETKALA